MVKSGKIISLATFAIVLAALIIVPFASADEGNLTPATTPFITIDPVGDHTLDEVFFISGTTNLPVSDSPLILQIYSAWFNPGGSGCGYQSNVIIEPGVGGINTWSCNATPGLWQTHGIGPRPHITAGAVTGEYMVKVSSPDPRISANATGFFSVLPAEDTNGSTAENSGFTPTPAATTIRDTMDSIISDSPVPVQNSTQGTAAPTGNSPQDVPTTHPAPLLSGSFHCRSGLRSHHYS
jgi:hypothetical protein